MLLEYYGGNYRLVGNETRINIQENGLFSFRRMDENPYHDPIPLAL
jgi:hypothetical protein